MDTKKRATKYVGVGIFLTILNFGTYTFLANFIFRDNSILWLSTLISSIICVIAAFFLHMNITWKERSPGKDGIIRFFIWNGFEAILFNPFLTWFFRLFSFLYVFAFNISSTIGLPFSYDFIESTGVFALMAAVTMFLNYLFYDRFVFKNKERND